MAAAALADSNNLRGAKHRNGGQPVDESAGQQHHQQQQLEQLFAEHDIQRTSPGQHTATKRNRTVLHGRWARQLPDRHLWLGQLFGDWVRWRLLPPGRALRAHQAGQDFERLRPEGSRGGHSLPRHARLHRYGDGWNALPVPWCDRKTGHDLVAAKP